MVSEYFLYSLYSVEKIGKIFYAFFTNNISESFFMIHFVHVPVYRCLAYTTAT